MLSRYCGLFAGVTLLSPSSRGRQVWVFSPQPQLNWRGFRGEMKVLRNASWTAPTRKTTRSLPFSCDIAAMSLFAVLICWLVKPTTRARERLFSIAPMIISHNNLEKMVTNNEDKWQRTFHPTLTCSDHISQPRSRHNASNAPANRAGTLGSSSRSPKTPPPLPSGSNIVYEVNRAY